MAELVNERKYTAHSLDIDRALTLIRHYCAPDPRYPYGAVNSVYFDTPHLASFREKIEGDGLKRKYRFRWYDVPGAQPDDMCNAFLEIKYRYGSAREKLRVPLRCHRTRLETLHPHAAWLQRLPVRHAPDGDDSMPLNLLPAVCIAYNRHRFTCHRSGLTVCVDAAIRVRWMNPDLFAATPPFDLQTVVCEIKGRGFDDVPWAHALYHAGFRIRSFSKYGECLNQIQYGGAPTVIRMSI